MDAKTAAKRAAWGLMGPTGVGKSALAHDIAAAHGCHIVNCDSVQVYAGFSIGSAKPTAHEQTQVPHHLYDVAPIPRAAHVADAYDAGAWRLAAEDVLTSLHARGQQALLCGGTGLYLRVLRQGLVEAGKDTALRCEWLAREQAASGSIYAELARLDPASAVAIGPHNVRRLLRALEVTTVCGLPASDMRAAQSTQHRADGGEPPAVRLIVVDAERAWLWPRLLARAEAMVARGLLDEVAGLLASGAHPDSPPMRSVGYREAAAVLTGTLHRAALAAAICQRSWQYARRQRTWLRREPAVAWLDMPTLLRLPPSQRHGRLLALWQRGPQQIQWPQADKGEQGRGGKEGRQAQGTGQ